MIVEPHVPELFKVIMLTDDELDELRRRDPVVNLVEFRTLRRRQADLRHAAEKMLCWNTNKGSDA